MHDTIFRLKAWTPRVQEIAKSLIGKIHEIAPELEVLFMGAAALGLPGKNDIDLDILCDKKDIAMYAQKLITLLGEPKEVNGGAAAWEFKLDGFQIDAMLSDPKISHVPLQRKRFELLKASPELRDEYKKLKETCDGLPYAKYEKRKVAFLEEKVLSSNK
jgi:GrpB-like predicted nucleotidyltransferase (UPF0157 family)